MHAYFSKDPWKFQGERVLKPKFKIADAVIPNILFFRHPLVLEIPLYTSSDVQQSTVSCISTLKGN